jgi:hypothetical protein
MLSRPSRYLSFVRAVDLDAFIVEVERLLCRLSFVA